VIHIKRLIVSLSVSASLLAQSYGPVASESQSHKVSRRVLSATACSASAIDGWQTTHFPAGVHESNPVGVPGVLVFKAAGCADIWYTGEHTTHKRLALWQAVAMNGLYAFLAWHNQSVIKAVR